MKSICVLNMEMAVSGDGKNPPSEIMLIPPGKQIVGRDGRHFVNSNSSAVINSYQNDSLDIPIDIEHSTQLRAPKGEAAVAVAWCSALFTKDDGSVWGKVEWNDMGRDLVVNRQYRYYSPAYIIDRNSKQIIAIKSVGLTNSPNLDVPALNQEGKGVDMDLQKLLVALGLPDGTTFEDALKKIAEMGSAEVSDDVALNSAKVPPLDKFVPTADYELAVNRAVLAESALKAQVDAALEISINREIDAALKSGKITPATVEYHVAQCRQEGGLERFKAFCSAAPVVAADVVVEQNRNTTDTALNSDELYVCTALGISHADFIAQRKGE